MNTKLRRSIASLTLATVVLVPTFASASAAQASTTTIASRKLNANTATKAQLTAAFTAVGVKNAAKWANEVQEYRPYKGNVNKLRTELAKYGIAPTQLELIIKSLKA